MEHRGAVVLSDDEFPATGRDVVEERAFSAGRGLGHIQQACVAVDVERDAAEVPAALGIEGHRRVAAGVVGMSGAAAADDGVLVGVGRGRSGLIGRVVDLLPERGQAVPPMLAVVDREVIPTLVEPEPAVVLTGQQVVRLRWVVPDLLLSLPPEGAVLIDPDVVAGARALTAVTTFVRIPGGGVTPAASQRPGRHPDAAGRRQVPTHARRRVGLLSPELIGGDLGQTG